MQKNEVMDGEDGPILGQGQYGIVHVTSDVKQPFFETGKKNQVEEYGENTSAGKRQFHFSNLIKTLNCCLFGQYIEHFFNAEKSWIAFAVYEG